MQSRHIVRDGIESMEKYVETLSLKAQAQFPATQPVISTAKKVGSPVIKGVRKLGDPVVDAIDNGLHNVVKNGTAFAGIAKNRMEAGVGAGVGGALHVVDRVLTPPPDEPKPPKTIRGLVIHTNNAIRYLCATKVKPVLGFDPYNKMVAIFTMMLYAAILVYHIWMTPWYMVRDRIAPTVLWAMDHKCDASHGAPNGVHGHHHHDAADDERTGSGSGHGSNDHRDNDEVSGGGGDERSSSSSGGRSSAASGSGGNTTGARCSTGTGAGVTREAAKTGTSSHHGTSGGSTKRSRTTSAKTNASSNSHDADT